MNTFLEQIRARRAEVVAELAKLDKTLALWGSKGGGKPGRPVGYSPKKKAGKRGGMSAAARAKIAASARARWKKAKAEGKSSLGGK